MSFSSKYAPAKLDDLIGNDEARIRVRQWLLNWLNGKKQRPLLIHGPTGCGKSSISSILSNEYGLTVIEMGSSDLRNKSSINRVLHTASSAGTLYGNQKIMFIDDVDAFQSADSGGLSAINELLKSNTVPIILTATNIWDKKLSVVRSDCELLEFKKITKSGIVSFLKKILIHENLPIDEIRLKHIAENASGDVRSAINDLQANSSGSRDVEKDIFERVRGIFKSSSYNEAKKYFSGDVDYSLLKLWVDENIPLEYNDAASLSQAFNYLSRADVFDGRIKKSHWGYFKYSIDFITAGVALSKSHKSSQFVRYQFPSYLRTMGQTVDRRAKLKSIGKKIGRLIHSNYREASEYLHILRHFLESDFDSTSAFYNLEEDEAAFILETTVEGIKKKSKKTKSEEKKVEVDEKKEDINESKPEKTPLKEAEPKKKPNLKGNLRDFL